MNRPRNWEFVPCLDPSSITLRAIADTMMRASSSSAEAGNGDRLAEFEKCLRPASTDRTPVERERADRGGIGQDRSETRRAQIPGT
jgi:hypothetical protein